MEVVRIGIIGIGNMGSSHAERIAQGEIPGMRLTAVADLKETRRIWAKEFLPAGTIIFQTAEELIACPEVDAVLIATPHYIHPDLAIVAMQQGKHVLCEKPAGVYTKQVRKMNEEAAKHNLIFGMMFNQRTNHIYRKMKELVDSKCYGQLKRMNWIITDWYRSQAYYNSGGWRATWEGEGGGVLLNQCPHNLDLIQWICGMPSKVQAVCHEGKWHDIEVEDDVTAYLEFPNGATGVFIASTGDAPGTNRFEIDLERAKLVCEGEQLQVYELEINEREFCYTTKEGFEKPPGHEVTIETDGRNPQHNGVLQAFAEAILNGTPLVADGTEGIHGLELSNAIHLSGWLNQPVTLPIDEDLFLEELNKKRAGSRKKTPIEEITFSTENSYGTKQVMDNKK